MKFESEYKRLIPWKYSLQNCSHFDGLGVSIWCVAYTDMYAHSGQYYLHSSNDH